MSGTHDLALPNFFIIGAPKCGTTSLYELLRRHPDVYLPRVKEPGFFSSDAQYARGIAYYSETFFRVARGFAARGEATPWYLYDQRVPQRIASAIFPGDVRFIAILRDPTARAYSMYLDQVAKGAEKLSFRQALEAEEGRANQRVQSANPFAFDYVRCGHYVEPLRRYMERFGNDKVLVLLQQDLAEDPDRTLRTIQGFIGIPETGLIGPITRANPASAPRSRIVQRLLLSIDRPEIRSRVRWLAPARAYRPILEMITKHNRKASVVVPLDSIVELQLRRHFAQEVDELERLLGRDLTPWRAIEDP